MPVGNLTADSVPEYIEFITFIADNGTPIVLSLWSNNLRGKLFCSLRKQCKPF